MACTLHRPVPTAALHKGSEFAHLFKRGHEVFADHFANLRIIQGDRPELLSIVSGKLLLGEIAREVHDEQQLGLLFRSLRSGLRIGEPLNLRAVRLAWVGGGLVGAQVADWHASEKDPRDKEPTTARKPL